MILETIDNLPDELKTQFEKVEIDGKEVYQDKDALELKQHFLHAKGDKDKLKTQLEEVNNRLSTFEQSQKEAIEAARVEALEQARKEGNSEELQRLLEEQTQDKIERAKAEGKSEAAKEFMLEKAKLKAQGEFDFIIKELNPLSKDHELLLIDHLRHKQTITDDGQIVYLNIDGGASSLDASGFLSEVKSLPTVKALIKAESATFGGGNANGSSRSGATGKKFAEYTGIELSAIRAENPAEYERLKNEHYN